MLLSGPFLFSYGLAGISQVAVGSEGSGRRNQVEVECGYLQGA